MCADIYEASISIMGFTKVQAADSIGGGTRLLTEDGTDTRLCTKDCPAPGHLTWDPQNIANQAFQVVAKYIDTTGDDMLIYNEFSKEMTPMYVCVVGGLVSASHKDLAVAMLRAVCKSHASAM